MIEKARKEGGLWFKHKGLILLLSVTFLFFISFTNQSNAADYPTKPVQIVVTYPPGGGADITSRLISPRVSVLLGQPVVITNKPGGGSVIGTYSVLAMPPDGYTILNVAPPQLGAPLFTKGATYNFLKDFKMINLSVTSPSFIVVNKDAPWQTLEELIAEAKKNPGKFTYSSPGYGSTQHFAGEIFKMYTGTDITQVPMDGTATAVTAVLGGHVNMTFPDYGGAYRYLESGSFRVLAVMDRKRIKQFSNIPTTVEKGFPNLITASFIGFSVKAETAKAIVEKLDKVFKEAVKDKEIIEKFEKTGWIVENLGSEEAAEFMARDLKMKLEVAKAANMIPK